MDSTSGDCGVEYSNPKSATDLVVSSTSYTAPITEGSSPVLSLRYESQKRRDWKTFLQYLENNKPPLTLASCTASHVIEFLKHLDQFGKTKMHLSVCANFGHRNSPTPCTCPLQQAWGSLDALIGRLRAAYEENGGDPDLNPFGSRAVRLYLKELREVQAKARGITYLKKRKRPTTTSIPTSVAEITQMVHGSSGSVGGGGVSTFVAGGFVTSMKQTAQVVGGNSCNGGGDGGYSCDVNGVVTSMTGITRVVDASRDSGGGSTSDAGGVVTSMTRTTQAIDGSAGACGDSTSDAGGVATSIAGTTQAIDRSTGGCGDSTSDAGGVVTSIAGITHVVDGCSTSKSGLCVTSSDEINQLVDGVIASGGGGSTSDAGGVVNDEKWMTPKFIPGTLVEVNLPDKQCHEAWVPAKILNVGYSQSLFLVGYNNSRLGYEEWCSKATVDALHIRPAPPENLEGKNFHVSEKVDFYYDCGWWSGEVTKVLAGNRYIVRSNYHKIEREFNQFELRCHVEWINGKWVQDSSDVVTKHDLVHVTGNDQADLLPVHNTAVFATESNTRKQIIELPTLESDNTDISPPSEKSDKGEATEGSLTVISHPKKVVPITPSQLKGLNDCPMPDLGVEKIGSVLDCDTFGRHETAVDLNLSALSNIEEEQCKLSKTQVQCLQMDLVVSSPQHCIKRQGEAKESSLFLTAHPKKAIPTTPSSSDGLVEHLAPNFGQESTLWNIEGEQCDLSKTQVEQRDLSIVQVECLDKSLVFQSPPVSIEAPDRQQCRRNGTRWRCSKMAVHGKLYCEKHLLERSLHNDKRRKTPRVLVIDQGPPSDQCRRSGTGWRCHEKVSPGKQHCEKHRLLLDRYNEKRRKRQSEQNHTSVNQSLLSDRQQCRRKGRGWRCPEMVSPGKRYCEKH